MSTRTRRDQARIEFSGTLKILRVAEKTPIVVSAESGKRDAVAKRQRYRCLPTTPTIPKSNG
jgi:hypothetical protein